MSAFAMRQKWASRGEDDARAKGAKVRADGVGNTRRNEHLPLLIVLSIAWRSSRQFLEEMAHLARLGALAQRSPRCARSFATTTARRAEVAPTPPAAVVVQKKPIGGFRGGSVSSYIPPLSTLSVL